MRNFNSYKKELLFTNNLSIGIRNNRVKQVQEWLVMQAYAIDEQINILEKIDGDFGNNTYNAVKDFQTNNRLIATGIVDKNTFENLTAPLKNAFSISSLRSITLRELIIEIAANHLKNRATEILNENRNKGPWVRAYCNGDDYGTLDMGPRWCAGFVKTIIDMACDKLNKPFNLIYKDSLDCDAIAMWAIEKNYLINNVAIDVNISKIKKGDLFLTKSTKINANWVHIGIIESVKANGDFTTIEGNASKASETTGAGAKVIRKNRNFFDVFYFSASGNNVLTKDPNGYENYYEAVTLMI